MLTFLDNLTVLLCVIGIFLVGKHFSKTSRNMDSFYQANKSIPWSLAVGTLVASWYGGAGVIGTIGYATTMGVSAFFIWSICAHLVRFPLALWVAPRISVKVNTTMTELINRYYGRTASLIGAVILVVSCLSIAEIAATGYVGVAAWNANKFLIAAAVVIISTGITCLGGLMGVAVTDMIFFFLMITSVCAAFPQVYFGVGGFAGINQVLSQVAPQMLTPLGGTPVGRAICLVVLCINVYKDPSFYQRFTAANSPRTGKRAMLMCFSIWLSFDMVLITTAMLIRTIHPGLEIQPEVAYVQLVLSNLPVVLRGLFVFGIMGAIISTIDSYFLIGGEIVSRDIINVYRKHPLSDRQSINITRISCIIFGIIGLGTAFSFPLVYDAFLFINSLSMCGLFVPVLGAILSDSRKTDVGGLSSMIFGSLSWIYFNYYPISIDILGGKVDALLIALPISFITYVIGNRFGKVYCDDSVGSSGEQQIEPVEWFGVDGALVALYAVLAIIFGYGMVHQVDALVGILAPGIAMLITFGVFARYWFEVREFSKRKA